MTCLLTLILKYVVTINDCDDFYLLFKATLPLKRCQMLNSQQNICAVFGLSQMLLQDASRWMDITFIVCSAVAVMSDLQRQKKVCDILKVLKKCDTVKVLFWKILNKKDLILKRVHCDSPLSWEPTWCTVYRWNFGLLVMQKTAAFHLILLQLLTMSSAMTRMVQQTVSPVMCYMQQFTRLNNLDLQTFCCLIVE